jgi:hypothetical protein
MVIALQRADREGVDEVEELMELMEVERVELCDEEVMAG